MKSYKKLSVIITCLIIVILTIPSCSKDSNNDDENCTLLGSVIDRNTDKCGCCPGWLIKLDDDTLKFSSVPNEDILSDLVNFYGYPVPIKFSFKDDNSSCSDSYKTMTCIDFDLELNCSKEGEIIDYISIECLCCPGWLIKTGQDTIKVLNTPIETRLNDIIETKGFPVSVKFDYKNSTGACKDTYKEITCMSIK